MRKLWRVMSALALLCLVLGIIGVGIGFFTGSSPVVIREHGALTEYFRRLSLNWGYLREDFLALLLRLPL